MEGNPKVTHLWLQGDSVLLEAFYLILAELDLSFGVDLMNKEMFVMAGDVVRFG